jgi:ATP-dependent Zn protease
MKLMLSDVSGGLESVEVTMNVNRTLNQILVEMDGFEPNEKVIVMAATNRADVLDPALLRPGRFDRRVILDLPDRSDREEILKIHARKKPFAEDVNLKVIAERTPGFSGADLYSLMNEAAILTAREDRKKVGQFDLVRSIEKVMLGPERKSHLMSKEEKKITAYHEAAMRLLPQFCHIQIQCIKFQSSLVDAQVGIHSRSHLKIVGFNLVQNFLMTLRCRSEAMLQKN